MDLKTALKNRLKDIEGSAVLGVGSELRGDDAAGILVAKGLKKWADKNKKTGLSIFFGGTAPENVTGAIKKARPGNLIIIDSADMGKPPGEVTVIGPEEIGGISFSTHSLPLNIMIDYLEPDVNGEIIVIGIQPGAIAFGSEVSKEVRDSVKTVSDTIKELILEEK